MRIAEIFRSIQGEGRLTGTESIFVRTSGCNLRCGYCDTPYASWKPEGEELTVAKILGRINDLLTSPPPDYLSNIAGQPCSSAANHGAASTPKGTEEVVGTNLSIMEDISRQPPPSPLPREQSLPSEPSPAPIAGPVRHVVITGGEPMLFPELVPLTARLRKEDWHITIETAGTLYLAVACDLMSISPKLSNSTPSADRDPRWPQRHTLRRHVPEVIRRLLAEYDCQLKFVVGTPDDCLEALAYIEQFPEIRRDQVMFMPEGIEAEALAEKAKWIEPFCVEHGLTFCPRRQVEWFGTQRGR